MSSIKEKAVKIYAKYVVWRTKKWSSNPIKTQEKVFKNLLKKGKKTVFGQKHSFNNITSHSDFSSLVPIRDYEKIKEYIDQIVEGKKNVLWPGKPIYFAKIFDYRFFEQAKLFQFISNLFLYFTN